MPPPAVSPAISGPGTLGADGDALAPTSSVEWAREYVYGTISTLVAIGGLTFERNPDMVSVGWVVVVGAVAIAMAHTISNLVVDWAHEERPFGVRTVLLRLRQSWPILSAAIPATIVTAISRSGLWSTSDSLWIAEGVGVAALAVVGVITAGRTRTRRRRVQYVVALVAVGLMIVVLELAAHLV